MPLLQRDFLRLAGDRAVIWIDPVQIELGVGSKWPVGRRRLRKMSRYLPRPVVALLRPFVKHREPAVIPGDAFGQPRPIVETPRYIRIADLLQHRDDVRRSAWYADLMQDLQEKGFARHKRIEMRSSQSIDAFFEGYVLPMIESLEREGYRPEAEAEGYASTAVIGPDGEVIKTGSGNHRFCIAKALGLPRFPLKIVAAHQDWVERTLGADPSAEDLLAALPEIEAGLRR